MRVVLSLGVAAMGLMLMAGGDVAGGGVPKGKPAECFCPVAGLPKSKDGCGCPGGYCPKKPRENVLVEHQGQKVQLCCSQCVPLFKKSPEKYAAVANHQLAARALAVQKACPLCGGRADVRHAVDVCGVRALLCSADCRKKAEEGTTRDRVDRVFGAKPFAKGFTVVGAK